MEVNVTEFAYTALNGSGKEEKGIVVADTVALAAHSLREQDLLPTRVVATPERAKKGLAKGLPRSFFRDRVPQSALVSFTRQLSTLIGAGVPLLRALHILSEQEERKTFRRIIEDVADCVEGGATLSEAFSEHPRAFDPLYVSMIKAGEVGGMLETTLSRLTTFSERSRRLKRRIVAASTYPVLVLSFALAVVMALLAFVVPNFTAIFADLDVELPLITKTLVQIGDATKRWLPFFLFCPFLIWLVRASVRRISWTRSAWDRLKLNLPLFGRLIRKIVIARLSRTLGTLLENGIPILHALAITEDTAGNEVMRQALRKVRTSVRAGESMTAPLVRTSSFPSLVTHIIRVGEETGQLDAMLAHVADTYDEEVDDAVEAVSSLIEPVLLVSLGAVVGFIVIALFLPLIQFAQHLC